jgi:hypothetical protein
MSNSNPNPDELLNINRGNANNATTRILLDFYMNLHNQTSRRIESLYDILDETRSLINALGEINLNNNRNRYNNYNTYENRNRNRNRNNTYENRNRYNAARRERNSDVNTGINNISTERTNTLNNLNNDNTTIAHFDWLNNIIYIQGRPYRIDFNNSTIPSASTSTTRNNPLGNDIMNIMQNFYSNVPVLATPAQIQSATRNSRFSNIRNPINNNCPITLEQFSNESNVTEILGCNHLFNPEALTSWFQNNVRCPVCRYDIRTNQTPTRHEQALAPTPAPTPAQTPAQTPSQTRARAPAPTTTVPPIVFPNLDLNVNPRNRQSERNSNSNPIQPLSSQQTNDSSANILDATIESAFNEVANSLLNQFLNVPQGNPSNQLFFHNIYDSSNNENIFRSYRI